jgi:acyl carrier protein
VSNASMRCLRSAAGVDSSVFGLSPSRPPSPRQGLSDIGMDSLMAVELGNRLGRAVGLKLPTTLAFEYPTIEALGGYLLQELGLGATTNPPPPEADEASPAEIDGMSANELSAALLSELEQIGY